MVRHRFSVSPQLHQLRVRVVSPIAVSPCMLGGVIMSRGEAGISAPSRRDASISGYGLGDTPPSAALPLKLPHWHLAWAVCGAWGTLPFGERASPFSRSCCSPGRTWGPDTSRMWPEWGGAAAVTGEVWGAAASLLFQNDISRPGSIAHLMARYAIVPVVGWVLHEQAILGRTR